MNHQAQNDPSDPGEGPEPRKQHVRPPTAAASDPGEGPEPRKQHVRPPTAAASGAGEGPEPRKQHVRPPTAAASDSVIAIRSLEVERGGKRVLPGISLEVGRGTITGLVGPSGSGKTTLMRSIVGVQVVAGGEVTVLGMPAGSPELRHRVGYVTQAPSVYGDLTVRENLEYFARVLGVEGARVDDVIATVGLDAQRDQVVSTQSGGERSRASLGVALLGEPDLLVLDEPTVGLDPVLRRDVWRSFRSLAAGGITILVSTHVMDEAERCDQLVLMREGKIVDAASPRALLTKTSADNLEDAFLTLAEAG